MIRDRTCTEPGCHIPARKCQIDHGQPWTRDGPTNETNGHLNCAYHNGVKGTQTQNPPITNHKPHLTWHKRPE